MLTCLGFSTSTVALAAKDHRTTVQSFSLSQFWTCEFQNFLICSIIYEGARCWPLTFIIQIVQFDMFLHFLGFLVAFFVLTAFYFYIFNFQYFYEFFHISSFSLGHWTVGPFSSLVITSILLFYFLVFFSRFIGSSLDHFSLYFSWLFLYLAGLFLHFRFKKGTTHSKKPIMSNFGNIISSKLFYCVWHGKFWVED